MTTDTTPLAPTDAELMDLGHECELDAIEFGRAVLAKWGQPAQQAPATLAVNDDLRDRLVAISEAIADQDDRAAQAMLREILKAPQPTPSPQAAQQAPAGATECRLVSHQDLKALAASINGDCYMGEEWEKACVTGMLAAPAAPSTPASPTVEGESK